MAVGKTYMKEYSMNRCKFFLAFFLCAYAMATVAAEKQLAPVGANDELPVRVQALIAKVKKSLRPLKAGTFEMGDWGTDSGLRWDINEDSRPVHKVTLDGFQMMAYKVTYDDFDVFTDATGNERVNMDEDGIANRAPRRPAGVSWYGAKAYCDWMAEQTKLGFDLPTEAQWEYAARSGGKRLLYATDNGKIDRERNFPRERQLGEKESQLPDVGSYPPNPAKLYGMSEDAYEWVMDWYDEKYYQTSPLKNPRGPSNGTEKVQRGSVGGMAEYSAMVFMRAADLPQPMESTYPNGVSYDKRVMVPFPGFSGYSGYTFRCVVNAKMSD